MLSHRFDEAFAFAHQLHREQLRKGSGTPYIAHLLGVAGIVLEYGGTEDQAIAAFLHDAAEDQGGQPTLKLIRERFGDTVAEIVSDCTDAWTDPKPDWEIRKEAYLAVLSKKPNISLLVSLADKVYNAEAIGNDYRVYGDALWERFTGGESGTRRYYAQLADIFARHLPGALSERLLRAVEAFR